MRGARSPTHANYVDRTGGSDRTSKSSMSGLVADSLPGLPRVRAILADRGYRGLARLAARKNVKLDIKAPPPGTKGFTPIAPLYKVEHAFARLGRWRRLSRCYEGTEASARAWLEVAAVAYMFDMHRTPERSRHRLMSVLNPSETPSVIVVFGKP